MSHLYWLSCRGFTVGVRTDDRFRIVETPPIARRFLGQPLQNLKRWMGRMDDFKWCYLGEEEA